MEIGSKPDKAPSESRCYLTKEQTIEKYKRLKYWKEKLGSLKLAAIRCQVNHRTAYGICKRGESLLKKRASAKM